MDPVTNAGGSAVHSYRISTVVPGQVTPGNLVHELSGADLAMKLHYLKGVYYYPASETVEGLSVPIMKVTMFPWLDICFPAAGRIRRDGGGRPYIKCNDAGVRILEAWTDLSLEEWLDRQETDRHRPLVPDKVIGPDLHFSPTVYLQITRFKCGGIAVGFSWAHLLGDPVSATNCINLWGQLLTGKEKAKYQICSRQNESKGQEKPLLDASLPPSVKQVEHTGDFWQSPSSKKMGTFFIELPAAKLNYLQSKMPKNISTFETLSAILWKSIARIRTEKETKLVTICRNRSTEKSRILGNLQTISTVESSLSPEKVGLQELANLIHTETVDEMETVQELVNRESEKLDVIVYGSNLTFVDMESIDIYGLELKGQKPRHVEYSIDGVGEEGAVLVLQGTDEKQVDGNASMEG
ncbi:hypothetical protein HPP92_013196 [Vanilla planifolia]|uniref:Uncharacterized protein n=1 Tax=Vanilla planifolia TaxID=51239 RepID=A0A835QU50_VANPL|nr:hypothetical protein HPP92_013196 [Vanilla planifolia]